MLWPELIPQQDMLDLTVSVTKVGDFPAARGGFGEVWKCIHQTNRGPTDVRLQFFSVNIGELEFCRSQ
jgi:hypothetical protein